jgi:hypothetical protein
MTGIREKRGVYDRKNGFYLTGQAGRKGGGLLSVGGTHSLAKKFRWTTDLKPIRFLIPQDLVSFTSDYYLKQDFHFYIHLC